MQVQFNDKYESTNKVDEVLVQSFETLTLNPQLIKNQLNLNNTDYKDFLKQKKSLLEKDVNVLYRESKLLARAMTSNIFTDIVEEPNYRTWEREFNASKESKLNNVSCSLVMEDQEIGMYSNNGYLFHSETSKVTYVSKGDSNTAVDDEENLMVSEDERMSLDELRSYIKETEIHSRPLMNEVKANLSINDIVGLFFVAATKDDQSALQMLLVRKFVKLKYQKDLPIFRYDVKGKLEKYDPPVEEVIQKMVKVKNQLKFNHTINKNISDSLGLFF